jgi:NADH dehydrogenase
LDFKLMNIFLLEAGNKLLPSMSERAHVKAFNYLKKIGIEVMLNTRVKDYDGKNIDLIDEKIPCRTLIWAAGVIANKIEGLSENCLLKNNRIKTNRFNQVEGYDDIFAIGDIACMTFPEYPFGHPQLAQVAIQQANNLAINLKNGLKNIPYKEFKYKDLGSMATIGRNLAVVDLKYMKFSGTAAWLFWLFVHLMAIVGVKNKVFIFINWLVNYFTYDQSLRLIIHTPAKQNDE